MALSMVRDPEPFRTDFASPDYARARLVGAGLYAASLLGVVLAAAMWWWASENRREVTALQENVGRVQQQASRLRDELRGVGFSPDDSAAVDALAKQVAALNQVLEAKAFSWTGLLNDLEAAVPRKVSVSSLRLDLKTRTLTLDGVALALQDVTALMTSLQESGRFTDVFLQQQRNTEDNRTEFTIQCTYRGRA
ncbi:MAG: PilN domain-containing protein [Nitrospirota bacterium]